MPEQVENKLVFTLTEVANSIRKTIADRYSSAYWIKAEINKLNFYAKSGHCFPELVDKRVGRIECEMRATLWKSDFERINHNFIKTVNEPIRDGISVLLLATISFEPKYGLSLIIRDIDPVFSIGELERERRETIARLHMEEIFAKNKQVRFALLPKRIAIISVNTSKGYKDFTNVIDKNIFGYQFFYMLFPAVLQGDSAVKTIKAQLNRIKKVKHHFDAVAIIRGGGGDVGLSCYNNYGLAKAICNFPLPVLTGIGHSTNLTVSEMVAHQSAITPTELADFLIQCFHNFALPIQHAEEVVLQKPLELLKASSESLDSLIINMKKEARHTLTGHRYLIHKCSDALVFETRLQLQSENKSIMSTSDLLARASKDVCLRNADSISTQLTSLKKVSTQLLTARTQEIEQSDRILNLVDPLNVIKRGYTITHVNGKLVKDIRNLKVGEVMETLTNGGIIESKVTKTKNQHE